MRAIKFHFSIHVDTACQNHTGVSMVTESEFYDDSMDTCAPIRFPDGVNKVRVPYIFKIPVTYGIYMDLYGYGFGCSPRDGITVQLMTSQGDVFTCFSMVVAQPEPMRKCRFRCRCVDACVAALAFFTRPAGYNDTYEICNFKLAHTYN